MLRCIICKQNFNDHVAAQQAKCSGGGHVLQEMISGSRNPDTGDTADFFQPSPKELREWAKKAKDLGYDID